MKDTNKGLFAGLLALGWIFVGLLLVSFGLTAGITYLIFWCFGWEWNWFIALGLWLLMILLKSIFGGNK